MDGLWERNGCEGDSCRPREQSRAEGGAAGCASCCLFGGSTHEIGGATRGCCEQRGYFVLFVALKSKEARNKKEKEDSPLLRDRVSIGAWGTVSGQLTRVRCDRKFWWLARPIGGDQRQLFFFFPPRLPSQPLPGGETNDPIEGFKEKNKQTQNFAGGGESRAGWRG